MTSLRALAERDGQRGALSLRTLGAAHGVVSLEAADASRRLRDYHQGRGGIFGSLGREAGTIRRAADGSYTRNHVLGQVRLAAGVPLQIEMIEATVEFMGLRCFDVNDGAVPIVNPNPSDEPYVIISVILLNPELQGTDRLVRTVKFEFDGVQNDGALHGGPSTVYQGPVPGVSGLLIAAAVFEQDQGDPKAVRDAIEKALLKEAEKAAAAAGAAVGAGAAASDAFAQSDITKWGARLLSLGITEVLGLGDDKIGVRTVEVSPLVVKQLVDQGAFERSLIAGVLPGGRTFNYPEDHASPISGADAKYQVYFRIRGVKKTIDSPTTAAA